MTTYSMIMQINSEPHQESLSLNEQGETITYNGLPGMVSFDLANIVFDEQSEGDTSSFLKKYMVQKDQFNTTPYKLNESWNLESSLFDEAIRMKGFIENILLSVPLDYPALAKVPKHKRVAVYIKTNMLTDILEHRFKRVRICPFLHSEIEIEHKMTPEKTIRYYDELKNKLKRNIHDHNTLKEFSKFFSFAWKYESDDILDIGWLELFLMAEADLNIKSCKRCKEFFIPSPPNALHCLKCRDSNTPQELYRYRKIESMSEKEKESARKWRKQYMKEYRRRKKEEEKELAKKWREDYEWRNN